MIVDRLIQAIIEKQNPSCVGLDTALEYLPDSLLKGAGTPKRAAEAVFAFNQAVIDAVEDVVPAVKIQIAYYEELGYYGLKAFADTARYAKKKGLFVIADAKRNDIGATASRYARAFLSRTAIGGVKKAAFPADFLTVNGYLGSDGVRSFLDECEGRDRGIFVLVKTSNPSSGELQDLRLADGRTVCEAMGDMVSSWGGRRGKFGYTRVGAVVGATYPEEAKVLRGRMKSVFFLVPGYGAQGGSAETLKSCFDRRGLGAIVNSSRGILCAYRKTGGAFDEAARRAALEMKEDLLSAVGVPHA